LTLLILQEVVEKWGTVDVLVNNAAAFVFGTIEEATSEDWDRVLNVNVKVHRYSCILSLYNCDVTLISFT